MQEVGKADLDGLGFLTSIGGDLDFSFHNDLTNLDGLSALTAIGGSLSFQYNEALYDCEACELLAQLTSGPAATNVHSNLDDSCTPVPENCP